MSLAGREKVTRQPAYLGAEGAHGRRPRALPEVSRAHRDSCKGWTGWQKEFGPEMVFNPSCFESGRCTCVWLGGTGCAILRAMDTQPSFADRLAMRIRRSKLDGMAVLLLEGFRPLAPIASQLAYLLQPLVGERGEPILEMGRLLEQPPEIDALIERLIQGEEGTPWTS